MKCIAVLVVFGFIQTFNIPSTYGRLTAKEAMWDPAEPYDESVNEYFDRIFANIRALVIRNEVEPIILPSDSDTFNATLFDNLLEGYVWVGDGAVTGISTLHRTGNMSLQYLTEGHEMIVEGHVGLTDLEGTYSSEFHLGPFKSDLSISLKVSFVSLDIKTDVFIHPSTLVLEECSIDELSSLQVKLRHIGLFDSRLESMLINTLTQLLEPIIANKIEATVCNILEHTINGAYEVTTVLYN